MKNNEALIACHIKINQYLLMMAKITKNPGLRRLLADYFPRNGMVRIADSDKSLAEFFPFFVAKAGLVIRVEH